ncbi:gastric inhibitory polypeptide receptor [Aplysia californica]|uniref:Gastric inhibitory polypeptide receptor n=1 Tax=Aplysia californica TaxID=6500 RepID=A0ABM1A4Q3_APLCA|nr:gastric inhibitory polypeptide receptor [Aplysia californica]
MQMTEEQLEHFRLEALRCALLISQGEPDARYCNSSFDSFVCWPATKVGHVAFQNCPPTEVTHRTTNVSKACLENGTWGPANYNACMVSEPMNNILDYLDPKDLMGVRIIYNIGYTSTTITLFIALFILLYFR